MDVDTKPHTPSPPHPHLTLPSLASDDAAMMDLDLDFGSGLLHRPLPPKTGSPTATPHAHSHPHLPSPSSPFHAPPSPGGRTAKRVVAPPVMQITKSDTRPCLRAKLDELLCTWLAIPETQKMLFTLIEDARAGRDIKLDKEAGEPGGPGGVPARLPGSPVTRFMDGAGVLAAVSGGEPPRSPFKTPMPIGSGSVFLEDLDLSLDLGKAGSSDVAASAADAEAKMGDEAPMLSPASKRGTEKMIGIKTSEAVVRAGVQGRKGPVTKDGATTGAVDSEFVDVPLRDEPMPDAQQREVVETAKSREEREMSKAQMEQADRMHARTEALVIEKGISELRATDQKRLDSRNSVQMSVSPRPPARPPTEKSTIYNGRKIRYDRASKPTRKLKEIPQFYFPRGRDVVKREQHEVDMMRQFFADRRIHGAPEEVSRDDLPRLVVDVIGLPDFLSSIIYKRIMAFADESCSEQSIITSPEPNSESSTSVNGGNETKMNGTSPAKPVTESLFSQYYFSECKGRTRDERLFYSLLGDAAAERTYLVPDDFKPLVQALLGCHPGLLFLRGTPEFQQRYSETVIARIFYSCSRKHNSQLFLSDIKRCRLLETLMFVSKDEDINRERRYFSYEHFYVLYCRFWELDSDHDLLIDRDDLMRYGTHSLTYRIVDRIFGGYGRPLDSRNPQEGKMSYTDFVWFCISEEDKNSDTAIDYWFRCLDLDGDGLITMYDLEYFYKEQLRRMECLGSETVQIRDILCQLLDMIKPNMHPPVIRRTDLRSCKLAGNFFNILFNLNKFFILETRDPMLIRQEHATPELSDWDRFAHFEYMRLSNEEEVEEYDSYEDFNSETGPVLGEAPF